MDSLHASNLVKRFGAATALHGVSVSVELGNVTVVMGPSGSGKSTLVRAISLVDPPSEGEIRLGDKILYSSTHGPQEKLMSPWPEMTVVFQQFFLWPHLTLLENITLPARLRHKSIDHLDNLLAELSITNITSRYPNEVSVGQRQRAALARSVLLQPRYLLLDEITSALDVEQIRKLTPVLLRTMSQGTGLLVVTHHHGFARTLLSHGTRGQFAFLENGAIVEGGDRNHLEYPETTRLKEFLSLTGLII